MQKQVSFTLVLFLLFFSDSYAQHDSLQAIRILQTLESRNQSIITIAYHSVYSQTNSAVENSYFRSEADIWQSVEPADSIFQAFFHIRGEDGYGQYDYYWDGQQVVEL